MVQEVEPEMYEGGVDPEVALANARKWQDCSCCCCDFTIFVAIGVAALLNLSGMVLLMSPTYGGATATLNTFVFAYLWGIRLWWVLVASCFWCMPKCANMCRCLCRGVFGLVTFAVATLGLVIIYNPAILYSGIAAQYTAGLTSALSGLTSQFASSFASTGTAVANQANAAIGSTSSSLSASTNSAALASSTS